MMASKALIANLQEAARDARIYMAADPRRRVHLFALQERFTIRARAPGRKTGAVTIIRDDRWRLKKLGTCTAAELAGFVDHVVEAVARTRKAPAKRWQSARKSQS
jgi:hypothetical protein